MIFDIIVLIVLLISAGIAFMRGFIREILTIAGVGGGLVASYFGGPLLIPYMRGWFGVEEGIVPERLFGVLPYDVLADVLSYGAIFVFVVIVLSLVSHMLAETARSMGLGAVDRTLGFIFGLVRGVLLLGLLYLPVHLFLDQGAKDAWFGESRTHFYLEKTADAMAGFLPDDADAAGAQAIEQIEDANTMRDKLKDIDLLKDPDALLKQELEGNAPSGDGYTDEFRDELDGLFEENNRTGLNE